MSSEKVMPDGYKQAGVHIASIGGRAGEIGKLATKEHRSVTNYIEFVLLQYLETNASSSEQQKTNPSRTR